MSRGWHEENETYRGVQSMLRMTQDASWVQYRGKTKNPNGGILIYCYKFAVIG